MIRIIVFTITGTFWLSCNNQKQENNGLKSNQSEQSHDNIPPNDSSISKNYKNKSDKTTDSLVLKKKKKQEVPSIPIDMIGQHDNSSYRHTKDMSEDAARYKHLLNAPNFIRVDSLKHYDHTLKDTVLLRNLSFEVTGYFWTNNQPTANGRANSFNGTIGVFARIPDSSFLPDFNIGYVPYLKYVESYYFFGNRVYVRSKGDWENHQFNPPDAAVYEYLNILTKEKVYIKGSNFEYGGYVE